MRSIQVNIDKPNFTINPTNCSPFSVDSQGIGDQGTVADFSSYFNAVNCASLPFKPSMSVRQQGPRKDTKRTKNPRMRFELRTRNGDANIKSLAVTLPKAFAIDQRHLGNICSKAQLEAESCAGRQPIGTRRNEDAAARPATDGSRLCRLGVRQASPSRVHPRRPGPARPAGRILLEGRQADDCGPGDPRRADRLLQARPPRRQTGLPRQHAEPLRPRRRRSIVAYTAQSGAANDADRRRTKTACGRSPRAAPSASGTDNFPAPTVSYGLGTYCGPQTPLRGASVFINVARLGRAQTGSTRRANRKWSSRTAGRRFIWSSVCCGLNALASL